MVATAVERHEPVDGGTCREVESEECVLIHFNNVV